MGADNISNVMTRNGMSKYETGLSTFNGSQKEDCESWKLRVVAAPEIRKLARAPGYNVGSNNVNKGPLVIIFLGLGDNPLRAAQGCTKGKAAWEKLPLRYTAASMAHKISIFSTLLNTNMKQVTDIRNPVAVLESQFNRRDAMITHVEESMRMEILQSSFSISRELASIKSLVNILEKETATYHYVTMLIIGESKPFTVWEESN